MRFAPEELGDPPGGLLHALQGAGDPVASPQITGAHAWIDCTPLHELEGGDHVIVIAQVLRLRAGTGQPLIFHRGQLGAYRQAA